MKSTITDHAWGSPQYLILNGRIRKGNRFQNAERVTIKRALARVGWRYRELVPFRNPIATGFRNDQPMAIQWLDFLVWVPHVGMVALVLYPGWRTGGAKRHEIRAYVQKLDYLRSRGTPYAVLTRTSSTQEYEIVIRRLQHRKNGGSL